MEKLEIPDMSLNLLDKRSTSEINHEHDESEQIPQPDTPETKENPIEHESTTHKQSEPESDLETSKLKSRGKKRNRIASDDDSSNTEKETLPQNKPKRKHKAKKKSSQALSQHEPKSDTETETEHNTGAESSVHSATSESDSGTRGAKQTQKRKFRCPNCGDVKYSVQELNNHYKSNHQRIKCEICERLFNTPSGLKKHRYTHLDKPFKCSTCGKSYPFQSQLSSHKITHSEVQEYTCNATSCNKSFKRKNEYILHCKIHYGIDHKCLHPGCNYSNYNERNLVAHQKIHTPEVKKYICNYCGMDFLHYMQRSCHIAKECKKVPK